MKYTVEDNWLSLTVDQAWSHHCVQEWLDQMVPSRPKQHLLFQNHEILLCDKLPDRTTRFAGGEQLKIKAFSSGIDFPIEDKALDVLYEDAFFLVVDKPSGMLVHPDRLDQRHTLVNQVAAYYQKQRYDYPIRPLHRLDRDTTGALLICKCSLLQPLMDQQLSRKKIYRTYLAAVDGTVFPKQGVIEKPIGKDRHRNNRYRVTPTGKPAITYYRTLHNQADSTLLECTLETGRTHQLRVHLASLKHPIRYDPIYGTADPHHMLALHAWKLTFYHPIYEKKLTVICPPPATFPIKP